MAYVKVNPNYTEVKVSENICKWEQTRSRKYWEYRRKWSENPKKQIVESFPLHLDIESTRKCNLLCPMCPRTIKIKRGEKLEEDDVDFDLAKRVIDEGAANGLYSVKFNYLGEPLMNRRLPELIKHAKDRGVTDVMFNTNAALLTEDMSRRLIKAGLDKLFISFDSPDRKSYEKIRVGTRFDHVLNNVKRFVEIRNSMSGYSPILRVSMVVMKENVGQVLGYIKLWRDVVDLVGFADYLNPQGMDKEDRRAIKIKKHKDFVCSMLYQRLFVHYNGKIGLCCTDYDAEMDLGNAKEVSIKDVWLGEKMRKIRKLHTTGNYKKIPLCSRCHIPTI